MEIINIIQRINKDKVQPLLLGCAALLFFVLVFILNNLYPLYADDWGYLYEGESLNEVVLEVFGKLQNQYLSWGGRSLVHAIAHFLTLIGLGASHVLNSLAFVLYIYIIYRISNMGRTYSLWLFLLIGLYTWLVLPAFNSTVLWLVGSANYMWGVLIVILFLFPYYNHYISPRERKGILYILFFFIAGIISGWTNENLFIAQVFFIIAVFLLLRRNKTSIPAWAWAGLIGVSVGGLIMLMAPGNYIRAEFVKESLGFADKSVLEGIVYRVMKVGYRYIIYILPVSAVYIVILYFYRKYVTKADKQKILLGSLLFFLSAHIAWLAMTASFIFPPRATFGIVTLIIIASGILYANLDIEGLKVRKIKIAILSICFILFIVNYSIQYTDINYLSKEFAKREVFLEQQKEVGNKYILFDNPIIMPSRYDFEDLSQDASHWLNKGYAKYYGVDSVRVVGQKVISNNSKE